MDGCSQDDGFQSRMKLDARSSLPQKRRTGELRKYSKHIRRHIDSQVRELLDFLTWISSFEGFTLRPAIASYS